MVAFVACFGNVNTSNSKFFTEDGISTEKIKSFASSQPSNVKFYVEVSGSMNGFSVQTYLLNSKMMCGLS